MALFLHMLAQFHNFPRQLLMTSMSEERLHALYSQLVVAKESPFSWSLCAGQVKGNAFIAVNFAAVGILTFEVLNRSATPLVRTMTEPP